VNNSSVKASESRPLSSTEAFRFDIAGIDIELLLY